jgi:agmatinase
MPSHFPYVGISTFFKAPSVAEPTRHVADVAVVGVPYDEATTARSGTRMGPRALREASLMWAYRCGDEPFYDGETGSHILGGVRWVDCDDIEVPPTAPDELRIGDHSVTYPVLKGVFEGRDDRPVNLVQFDSHMDYWDEEGGQRYTHASPIIRAHEEGLVGRVAQYGIRNPHTPYDNIALAQERGVSIFWCEPAKRTRVEELVEPIPPGSDVYLTFDIDALDPAIAPGTGTPEPGGFTYYEAKAIVRAICARANVVGMDLVEVNPLYDGPGQLTALHGAKLIIDAVGAAFADR